MSGRAASKSPGFPIITEAQHKDNSMQKVFAWGVHLFTASGLLAGFMGLLAAVDGDYRRAMFWMLVTLIIDGIDGTFARMARVREVLPRVDGKMIDYVIDFFTYAILPAYLFYVAIDMPDGLRMACCFAMLLSGAIYYGLEGMVSEDGKHFVGFPVMWNMAVYVFIFVIPEVGDFGLSMVVFGLAVLHFVPVHFAYPSMGGRWWALTLLATVAFIGSAVMNVYLYPEPSPLWRGVCLAATLYYGVLAIVDTAAAWRKSLPD
jgi:phosphatidylcholine synthase